MSNILNNFCSSLRSNPCAVVKATDMRPVNVGSTPADTQESVVTAGMAPGQNCCRMPVKVLHILVGM